MGDCASVDIIYGMATHDTGLIPYEDDDGCYEPIFDHYEWQKEFYERQDKPYPGWSVKHPPEIAEAGCMFGSHGYSDDSGLFLGIIDSHLRSDWDSIAEIDPLHFAQNSETLAKWNQKLKQFCELMGIPFQKPKWLMMCSY